MSHSNIREGFHIDPEVQEVAQARLGTELLAAFDDVDRVFGSTMMPVIMEAAKSDPKVAARFGIQAAPPVETPVVVPDTVPEAWVQEAMATTAVQGGMQ